jgi:hypothetical protein
LKEEQKLQKCGNNVTVKYVDLGEINNWRVKWEIEEFCDFVVLLVLIKATVS